MARVTSLLTKVGYNDNNAKIVLTVQGLQKTYTQRNTVAVREVSFDVCKGEFLSIVGPSGSGKTTLLKCIIGLMPPSTGKILLDGREVLSPPPEMAIVFQDYSRSLFPWLTVRENVLFALRKKSMPKQDKELLAIKMLQAVGLDSFLQHYPWELSGGMQQRVAIARCLAYQPEVLLMDEPFASVDALTRGELEDLVLRIWGQFGITILFVTHDIDESVYLSDRVLVLSAPPSVVQEEVYVRLPRPRDQITTRGLAEFVRLRTHVYQLIRATKERS